MSFIKPKASVESSTKKEPEKTLLALDIGSEFIKCIMATPADFSDSEKPHKLKKSPPSGKLKILGYSKSRQVEGSMSGGRITNIKNVIATAEEAISSLEEQTGLRAKSVVVGLSGELVKSHISTIRYRRDSPNKLITDSELKNFLQKIESRAEAKIRREVSLETDNPEIDLALVNSALVSLSIDGYKINNPVGFRGSELLIEYYTAFAPTISTSAIEKVCIELELDLVAIAVEPFALCRACLGDDVETDFSAILIDIGGGTTDLAVIDSGEICGTASINLAGQSFTRQISEGLGVRPATAEKYKVNLEDESLLSDSLINKTTSALNKALPVWLAGVSVALEDVKNLESLPTDIFLSGGSASLLPLEELLATSDWYSSLPFERRPVVHLLDPVSLPDFIFNTDDQLIDFDASFITALGLLRVAVDTLYSSPEKDNFLTKIQKLLAH